MWRLPVGTFDNSLRIRAHQRPWNNHEVRDRQAAACVTFFISIVLLTTGLIFRHFFELVEIVIGSKDQFYWLHYLLANSLIGNWKLQKLLLEFESQIQFVLKFIN